MEKKYLCCLIVLLLVLLPAPTGLLLRLFLNFTLLKHRLKHIVFFFHCSALLLDVCLTEILPPCFHPLRHRLVHLGKHICFHLASLKLLEKLNFVGEVCVATLVKVLNLLLLFVCLSQHLK